MSNFFESYLAIILAIIFTAFAYWNPFRWRFLRTDNYEKNKQIQQFNAEFMLWRQLIEVLVPVKQLLRTEIQYSPSFKQLRDASILLEKIGVRLIDMGKTTTQFFTGRSLRNSALSFQSNVFGESSVDGVNHATLQGIIESIDDLQVSIENRSASLVYIALIRLNFVIQTKSIPPSIDPQYPPLGKDFRIAIEKLTSDHFKIGKYTALDDFIDTWKPKCLEMGDIYALAFVSALESFKTPISMLLRTLSLNSIHPDGIILKSTGMSVVKSILDFANAYYHGDILEQYTTLVRIIKEGININK